MVYYPNPINAGLKNANNCGDGTTVNLQWHQATTDVASNRIAYNIYYSTIKEDVFTDGIKYISIDDSTEANIINLVPGQLYFFCVRPIEYNPSLYNLSSILPIAYDNLRIIPSSLLRSNISALDTTLPLLDTFGFPSSGIIQVGVELIQYTSISTNDLLVPGSSIIGASLIDQGGGNYYTRNSANIGDGYLINLTLEDTLAISEDWEIRCVGIQVDGYGIPMTSTAKFASIGSISGIKRDGYSNPYIWVADGYNESNDIFSFSITESSIYNIGDSFLIKIAGSQTVPGGRGYNNTIPRQHNVDGYDGGAYWNPDVNFFIIGEDRTRDRIFMCQGRFEYPNFPRTDADGYHQVTTDLLTTDLSVSDQFNEEFPAYDYSGYHRTDPVQIINGTCIGSYIGGEVGCIDKYGNVNMVRGFSLQDQNTQRQELGLSITGRPAVLVKRMRTGITCSCFQTSSEYPDDRCPFCLGTKFVSGFEQYFNPRRSDGRIMVRCGPADEDLKMTEAGMESEFTLDFWTLTVPTIKDRDVIILFDMDGVNEEYRYEVLSVTRNNTAIGLQGGQKFKAQRIRKFDPAYQIRVFSDSSMFPSKLNTSIGFTTGILPHTHTCTISEKIVSINQINQTTDVVQGHSHAIVSGVILEAVGHRHTIILP